MNRKTVAGAALLLGAAAVFFWSRPQKSIESPLTSMPPELIEAPDPATPETKGQTTSSVPAGTPESKGRLLDSILASRNDNDPRLDQELRVLDDATKDLFRQKYQALPPEKRNERGTIVFLLGRNLTNERDFAFLCEVLREAPCNSLADCQGNPANTDYHHEAGESVTLAYPQYVALSVLERFLGGDRSSLTDAALKTARCGQDSRVESIAERANSILGSNGR